MADKEQIEIPVLIKSKDENVDSPYYRLNRFSKHFGQIFGQIAKHPFVLAGIALIVGGTKAISAWRQKESALNSLNQALLTQGIYSRELSEQYQELARAVQKETTFADEEVLAAQASMQSYLGGQTISKDMLMRVADFAAANGMQLTQAAQVVGKSVASDSNALGRYGIVVKDGLSKSERLSAIMGELDKRFRGQAAAGAQGLGSIDQMRNAMNDLLERVGKSLAPLVSMFVTQLAQTATEMMNSPLFQESFTNLLDGSAVVGTFLKTWIGGFAQVVKTVFEIQLTAVRGILTGRFEESFQDIVGLQRKLILEIPRDTIREALLSKERVMAAKARYQASHDLQINKQLNAGFEARARAREEESKLIGFTAARSQKELFTEMAKNDLKNNATIKKLNAAMEAEKDETARLELELKKRKMISDRIREREEEHQNRISLFASLNNKAKLNITQNGLAGLSELKNSKYGPQVLIGKAASIASIGVNTSISIPLAIEAFAAIPPPVGEALGAAFASFLTAYAAEQIANIAGVTIDNPGRIGETPFNFETVLARMWNQLGNNARLAQLIGREVFGKSADVADKVGDAIQNVLGEFDGLGELIGGVINLQGDILAAQYRAAAWIYDKVYGAIADVLADITDFIAGIVADALEAIGNAIADAADFLFGWLFAEGGAVTHAGGMSVVTPLHKSGIQLGTEVSVRIRGGIIPSPREARRVAQFIHSNLR